MSHVFILHVVAFAAKCSHLLGLPDGTQVPPPHPTPSQGLTFILLMQMIVADTLGFSGGTRDLMSSSQLPVIGALRGGWRTSRKLNTHMYICAHTRARVLTEQEIKASLQYHSKHQEYYITQQHAGKCCTHQGKDMQMGSRRAGVSRREQTLAACTYLRLWVASLCVRACGRLSRTPKDGAGTSEHGC